MGYRFLALGADPNSALGGSTYDRLTNPGPLTNPLTEDFYPVESATVSAGYEDRERNEVRGRRGRTAPHPWRAAPTWSFRVLAYPAIAQTVYPRALGGAPTVTGDDPAPIVTGFEPAGYGALLPSFNITLVREDQMDLCWGCWVDEVETEVTSEGELWLNVSGRALFHKTLPASGTFNPDTSGLLDPYAGVTLKAKAGNGTLVDVPCLASMSWTYSNELSDDDDVRFCKGANVVRQSVGGRYRYRHYPSQHRLGRQAISATLQFGTTRPDMEARRLAATSEMLVAEVTGNPITPATTPVADQLMRWTFHRNVLTGGEADELSESDEIKSSYEFGAYLDEATNKDITVEFVDAEAVALA